MRDALAQRGKDGHELRIRVDVSVKRVKKILKTACGMEVSPYPNKVWNRVIGGRAWKRPLVRALGVWFGGMELTLHHASVSPFFDGGRVAEPMPTIVYGRIVADEAGTCVCVLPRGEGGQALVRFVRMVLFGAALIVAARFLHPHAGNSYWRVPIVILTFLGVIATLTSLSLPLSWLALTPKQRRADRTELLAVLQRVLAPYQVEGGDDAFRRPALPE